MTINLSKNNRYIWICSFLRNGRKIFFVGLSDCRNIPTNVCNNFPHTLFLSLTRDTHDTYTSSNNIHRVCSLARYRFSHHRHLTTIPFPLRVTLENFQVSSLSPGNSFYSSNSPSKSPLNQPYLQSNSPSSIPFVRIFSIVLSPFFNLGCGKIIRY